MGSIQSQQITIPFNLNALYFQFWGAYRNMKYLYVYVIVLRLMLFRADLTLAGVSLQDCRGDSCKFISKQNISRL